MEFLLNVCLLNGKKSVSWSALYHVLTQETFKTKWWMGKRPRSALSQNFFAEGVEMCLCTGSLFCLFCVYIDQANPTEFSISCLDNPWSSSCLCHPWGLGKPGGTWPWCYQAHRSPVLKWWKEWERFLLALVFLPVWSGLKESHAHSAARVMGILLMWKGDLGDPASRLHSWLQGWLGPWCQCRTPSSFSLGTLCP